jgi:hypothetical protein
MYSFTEEAVISGDIGAIWSVATDVPRWPSWDPHEEKARIDGEFEAGTRGWSKPAGAPAGVFAITEVEPGRMWATRAGIPFGHLRLVNRYDPVSDGKVRVSKRVEVRGVFGPLFHLIWEKNMRAGMRKTFAALEAEARGHG